MPPHARNPSTAASDGGSESSLTDISSSDAALQPAVQSRAASASAPASPRTPPPPTSLPAQARNPSAISKTDSLSSISSLSSSGSAPRVPRPQTPNTRNAGDVPGLTLSPCTVLSSPESTKSYGFSAVEDYPCVGNVVRGLLESDAEEHNLENLYAQAQKHLRVFDDPLYALLDSPDWVRRISAHATAAEQPLLKVFTVRTLIKSMYDTAEDLGLKDGKRYVMSAVCACAIQAKETENKELDLAMRIQKLASTWAAFLLWPFFAQQHNTILSVDDVSRDATPTWSETGSLMDQGLSKHRKKTLPEEVLERDGFRCILSRHWHRSEYERRVKDGRVVPIAGAREVRAETLQVAHIFKRALAKYSSSSNNANEREKFRSTAITFEILRHYCRLPSKYLDDVDLLDGPGNAMSLISHFHTEFDKLNWCLKPTEIPNRYEVKEYNETYTYMYFYDVPKYVTFKDHSTEDAIEAAPGTSTEPGSSESGTRRPPKRPREAMGIELPDGELIRLHAALTGVLRMSGAAGVFKLIMERRGPDNPPVPSADGNSFMKDVVDPTMHNLRQAVAGLVIVEPE